MIGWINAVKEIERERGRNKIGVGQRNVGREGEGREKIKKTCG